MRAKEDVAVGVTTEDREMIRDAVRGLLEQAWPVERYEDSIRSPDRQRALWYTFCEQGFASLGGDPASGGMREIVVVMEELGRAACPMPLLPVSIINMLAVSGAADGLAELLPDIASGKIIPAISFGDCDRGRQPGRIEIDGDRAAGAVSFVESGGIATHLFACGSSFGGAALISCADAIVEETRAMGAPGLSRLSLSGAPVLARVPLGREEIEQMLGISRIGLAARSLGSMRRVFDMAVDYAKERRQFGRAIGAFQALQHKLANNLIMLEGARLSIEFAAELKDKRDENWPLYGAAAFAAAQSLRRVALENQHAFGAIGYAEEHEAPRHFKRVHVDLLRHGGGQEARADLADYYLSDVPRRVPELDLGADGNAFREEVRNWLEEHWPQSRSDAFYAKPFKEREYDRDFAQALGRQGWIGLNWPVEFGGAGKSPLELMGFMEVMERFEAPRAGAPIHGNMLIVKGTKEQQEERLPAILAGKVIYGMGLSEPNAGSDLASLKTRAERDGDEWVINGQKIWCTSYYGEYLLVAARTDPEADPRHAGITAFIVPTDAPGLTIVPTGTMYDGTFANLFFDDVRVPDKDRVGAEGDGWEVIISSLVTERGYYGGQMVMQLIRQFEKTCDYLREALDADGGLLRGNPLVRDSIGDMVWQIEMGRRLAMACARSAEGGVTPIESAAISKVYCGELMERYGEAMLDILGLEATLSQFAPAAPMRGQIEQKLRYSLMWVISLGTNEIQRNIIAKSALGLPSR